VQSSSGKPNYYEYYKNMGFILGIRYYTGAGKLRNEDLKGRVRAR
jgi:hypothetical protein